MFRIKEYKKGFVVEVRKSNWLGRKYWTHFISAYGIDSMAWYHYSYKYAEMNLISKIEKETMKNSIQLR